MKSIKQIKVFIFILKYLNCEISYKRLLIVQQLNADLWPIFYVINIEFLKITVESRIIHSVHTFYYQLNISSP